MSGEIKMDTPIFKGHDVLGLAPKNRMIGIKPARKPQQDRLLKRLNSQERRQQEQLRLLIMQDQIFKIA